MNDTRKGILLALACFGTWGLFPVFWYPLNHSAMPAGQILAQRIVWSSIFSFILLLWMGQWDEIKHALKNIQLLAMFIVSAFLIAVNWLVYLWAITHHHVVDSSLGYFINPLFNVLLGFLIFKEKITIAQWIALGLATGGIIWLSILAGQIPYIGLLLAASFGFYAVVRKLAPMPALAGLVLETLLLVPFALMYLVWCAYEGTLILGDLTVLQKAVLLTSGAVTTLPLLAFTASAKRINLSLLGILQNISPTFQLFLGLAFGETLSGERLIGYGLVWLGVLVFLLSVWRTARA